MQSPDSGDPTFRVLLSSPVLSTFRNAFEAATELPVVLAGRSAIDWGRGRVCAAICPNLKNGHPDCAGCLRFPEPKTSGRALTLRCQFGLVRTAVPVRANGEVVAYLWTGWISLHRAPAADPDDDWEPIRASDERVAPIEPLLSNGRRVLSREQYSAMVEMLASFAAAAHPFTGYAVTSRQPERCVAVARALQIIAAEYRGEVSLQSIARRCNAAPSYFSGLFRRSMDATFTEYLTRFRVEKAKGLLMLTDERISEIADGCGFGSHSQFNRMFQRIVGTSPRAFRAANRNAA